jgi:hypothetical protein
MLHPGARRKPQKTKPMQTLKIKWLSNPAAYDCCYSVGEVCELEAKRAQLLIDAGAAELHSETATTETAASKPQAKAETATAKPQRRR